MVKRSERNKQNKIIENGLGHDRINKKKTWDKMKRNI